MMRREQDKVVLILTADQFDGLQMALGVAAGFAASQYGIGSRQLRCWIRLADEVNEGNPEYRPYNLRSEALG